MQKTITVIPLFPNTVKAAEGLDGRIAAVETRAAESKRVLWEEVQSKIERLEMVVTDPLDGIIARLTHECGGNVHKAGVVTVTASSVGYGQPENVVDLTSDSKFYTDNSRDSWIRYDFGNLRRRIC